MIGIPEIQIEKIMKDFLAAQFMVHDLANRSFLNEKLKRMYIRSYEERLKRLRRSSYLL